jgi:quinolinate synthase
MKKNSLAALLASLEEEKTEIVLEQSVLEQAAAALKRMINL